MHEMSLIADLVAKLNEVAQAQNSERVTRVGVALGALSHISADHFREHFVEGTRGSVAEGAELDIRVETDMDAPDAQDIRLTSVEVDAP